MTSLSRLLVFWWCLNRIRHFVYDRHLPSTNPFIAHIASSPDSLFLSSILFSITFFIIINKSIVLSSRFLVRLLYTANIFADVDSHFGKLELRQSKQYCTEWKDVTEEELELACHGTKWCLLSNVNPRLKKKFKGKC